MNFSGGTVLATNNGSVTAGNGVLIQSGRQGLINNPINVSGTTSVTLTNTNNLSTTAAIGAYLSGGALAVSAGSLTLSNSGNLSGLPGEGTNGMLYGTITISGTGSMSLSNTGTISTGTGVRLATNTQAFSQTGGAFSITNGSTGTVTAGLGAVVHIISTTSLTGGTFSNTNNATVNGGNATVGSVAGSYFLSSGALTLGGSNVTLANTGTISPSTLGATGSLMSVPSITTSGSGWTFAMTNSGTVENFSGNVGTYLLSSGAMTLGAGTWTATNTGTISTGIGVEINGETSVSLSGASLSLTNGSAADVSASSSFGCQLLVGTTLTFPSSSTSILTLENSQALAGTGGVGVQATIGTGSSLVSGTLNIINDASATIAGAATGGVEYLVTTGDFDQSGGTVALTNSGVVSSTGGGPYAVALASNGSGNINLTGGSFSATNNSTGSVSTTGYGALVSGVGVLTVGGAGVTVSNAGAISTSPGSGYGSVLSGNGVTVSSGAVTLTNSGTISGSFDTGAFLYNNSSVSGTAMNFSGGTVGATNSGSITAGAGVLIQSGRQGLINNPINVSGGNVFLTNTNGLSTTSAIGASLSGGALTVSAGSLALSNSGNLSGLPGEGTNGIIFGNILISGTGMISLSNSGTLGTAPGSGITVGVKLATGSQAFSQTGGAFSNTNTSTGAITSGIGSFVDIASTTSLTGGTFSNTNNGAVTGGNATVGNVSGSYFLSSEALTLGGSNITLANTGTISPSSGGATGSLMNVSSITTSGSGWTLAMNNSGTVENFSGNVGTYLLSSGAITIGAGTWTALNTGTVSTGVGVEINGETTVSLTGGSITLTNDSTANVSSTGFGCEFVVGQTLSLPSGSTATLALVNNQALTGIGGVGARATAGTGTTIVSGTLDLTNTNTIGPSSAIAGAQYINTSGVFSQTGGTINLNNSGAMTSTATAQGVGLSGGSTGMSLTGGSFNLTNSGPLDSMIAGVTGAYASTSGPLTLGGATVTLTNTSTGTISSPLVGSIGCQLSGFGITQSAGTVTFINDAALSGTANNLGAYLYNSSTGPITFSGGTFSGTNNTSSIGNSFGIKITSGPAGVSTAPIVVSGGSVTLTNTGDFSITEGIGAYIQGSSLTVSAGALNLNNMGNLTSFQSQGVTSIFSTLGISGGSINLLNSGNVDGPDSQEGIIMMVASTYSQTGGTYSNANSGTNSTGSGQGVLTDIGTTTTLSAGTLINTNSGNVSVGNGGIFGKATGSYFIGKGAMDLSGGNITLSNSGMINASGSAATGSLMFMASITASTPGTAVSMTNAGPVENFSGNIGTALVSSGAIALSAGAWTATNTGTITSGTGLEINGETTITLSGGSISILNDSTAAVSSSGIGCQLIASNSLSLSSGTSALTLQNNQALSSGTGVLGSIPNITFITPAVTMSAGTLNVTNTAALHGTATGAALQVSNGAFNQTGGTFTVSNSGTNSGSGIASYIQAPTITVSGTGTFNNPNGLVAATMVTLTSGGILQSGTATVPGVFQDASFGSTTDIINDGGTFVSGTLNPTPGQTIISGVFTQNAGTYTVVIGNLTLPSNQGISFLTVNGTGVVNLDSGTLNIIPATGFVASDIPSGLNKVQFIQASTIINGVFTPLNITSSIPGFSNITYETLEGNQGWLLFYFVPPPPPSPPVVSIMPTSTPIPYQPITIATVNFINTFLGRELIRMQEQLIAADQSYEDRGYKKSSHHRKESANTAEATPLSLLKNPIRAHTIADMAITDADQEIGFFMNSQSQTKQQQLASAISECNDNPWNIYFGPLADLGKINNKRSQLGANFHSLGALAGVDYRFSQFGVGILFDYEHVKANLHKHGGDFWINQFHATAYSTYVPESFSEFALNGIVGSGGAWYNIHRHILGLKESTHAKSRGAEVDALLGAQYLFSHCQFASIPPDLEIIPMVNLQYIYQGIGSYKEHRAGINDFKFHKYGFQSLRSTLGTWLQYRRNWNNLSLTSLVNISWQREFLDQNQDVNLTPINAAAPSGTLTIFGAGRNTLLAGLDLLFEFYNTYGVEASYDFEYNSLYRNNGFYLGFNLKF